MRQFKAGDKVVHLGGACGLQSRNRGRVFEIKEGPVSIKGYAGSRYIVDRPAYIEGRSLADVYHVDERYLLKLS